MQFNVLCTNALAESTQKVSILHANPHILCKLIYFVQISEIQQVYKPLFEGLLDLSVVLVSEELNCEFTLMHHCSQHRLICGEDSWGKVQEASLAVNQLPCGHEEGLCSPAALLTASAQGLHTQQVTLQ